MRRSKQIKIDEHAGYRTSGNKFTIKNSINLNDLLTKRKNEKRIDKKLNFLIFAGATAVAAIIISLLLLL